MITNNIWSRKLLLLWLLLPFSWVYALVSQCIRISYLMGFRYVWRAPVPVVVVGNLTVGGTGKTPVVIWLVEQLTKHGIKVGVVARGYGGKAKHYPLLVHKDTQTHEAGDEPVLIFQRTGAPVAVAPRRSEAIKILLIKHSVNIIISDDGLQHYALARDKEIVVIDGIHRFGNGWWLPAGPMREHLSRLRKVDAIITNGGVAQSGEISMKLVPSLAVNLLTSERCEVTSLCNLVAIAGIGYPSRFFATLENCGVKLEKCVALSDHQVLNLQQIKTIVSIDQSLIMTEKDAVKYKSFAKSNWWYLPVHVKLNSDQSEKLLQQIVSLI